MAVSFYCPRWGSDQLSWESFCARVSGEGYDGFEVGIVNDTTEKELHEIWNTAERYRLKVIAQFYDSVTPDFSKHFDVYSAWLEKLKAWPCVKIDSQTGRDIFSFEQNHSLVKAALAFTAASGVPVMHETHRHKCLFAAHVAKEYLQKIPALQITLDASHWVCVGESFLEDQSEAMQLAIERAAHIHARVGYPEGPQVPDPRVAEWQQAVDAHIAWWDKIVARNENMTITPEFGPYPYMVHLPDNGKPISNQWDINVYMMQLLKKRYQ